MRITDRAGYNAGLDTITPTLVANTAVTTPAETVQFTGVVFVDRVEGGCSYPYQVAHSGSTAATATVSYTVTAEVRPPTSSTAPP